MVVFILSTLDGGSTVSMLLSLIQLMVCSFNNISKSINIGMTAVKLSIKMCVEGFCSVVDLFVSRGILCPQKWENLKIIRALSTSVFIFTSLNIHFRSSFYEFLQPNLESFKSGISTLRF